MPYFDNVKFSNFASFQPTRSMLSSIDFGKWRGWWKLFVCIHLMLRNRLWHRILQLGWKYDETIEQILHFIMDIATQRNSMFTYMQKFTRSFCLFVYFYPSLLHPPLSLPFSSSLVLYLKVKWWFRNETKIDHMHKPYSCGLSSGYRFFGDFQFHIHWHSLSTQTRIRDWAIVGYWTKSGNKRGVRWNDGTKQ